MIKRTLGLSVFFCGTLLVMLIASCSFASAPQETSTPSASPSPSATFSPIPTSTPQPSPTSRHVTRLVYPTPRIHPITPVPDPVSAFCQSSVYSSREFSKSKGVSGTPRQPGVVAPGTSGWLTGVYQLWTVNPGLAALCGPRRPTEGVRIETRAIQGLVEGLP